MKITKILLIDWCLLPLSILSFFTGLELHLAGHGNSHETWHNWAVVHIAASLLFLVAGACHIKTHSKWYRSLLKNGLGRKSKTTLVISIVFVATVITGIALLGVEGANSGIGLWHYKIGLLMGLFAIIHIVKRKTAFLSIFKR